MQELLRSEKTRTHARLPAEVLVRHLVRRAKEMIEHGLERIGEEGCAPIEETLQRNLHLVPISVSVCDQHRTVTELFTSSLQISRCSVHGGGHILRRRVTVCSLVHFSCTSSCPTTITWPVHRALRLLLTVCCPVPLVHDGSRASAARLLLNVTSVKDTLATSPPLYMLSANPI